MNVTTITRTTNTSLVSDTAMRDWAQREVKGLLKQLGSWQAVTDALAQYHRASRSAWWHVSQGRSITIEKVNALRAYNGVSQLPTYVARRSLPPELRDKRRNYHVSPELFARMEKQRGGMSQGEYMEYLAELWDERQRDIANIAKALRVFEVVMGDDYNGEAQ